LTKSRLRSIIKITSCCEGFTVLPDAVPRVEESIRNAFFVQRIGSSADEATPYQARRRDGKAKSAQLLETPERNET
jgi:hypothetical protein